IERELGVRQRADRAVEQVRGDAVRRHELPAVRVAVGRAAERAGLLTVAGDQRVALAVRAQARIGRRWRAVLDADVRDALEALGALAVGGARRSRLRRRLYTR